MRRDRSMHASERWFRLLLRLYPVDFRDEMGEALLEAYRDRAGQALSRGGVVRLAVVWVRALLDALRNGLASACGLPCPGGAMATGGVTRRWQRAG